MNAKEKKEQVLAHLKQLRKVLREIQAGVTEEQKMPDPVAVRDVMNQMEELLEVLQAKASRKPKK